MTTHSRKVFEALKTGLETVLAGKATVHEDENRPQKIGRGIVVVRQGEPGEAQVVLSPRSYSYDHALSVEITAHSQDDIGTILGLIDGWVEANRSLTGLTDWLEPTAPRQDVAETFGTAEHPYALFDIVASYTTPSPLG